VPLIGEKGMRYFNLNCLSCPRNCYWRDSPKYHCI